MVRSLVILVEKKSLMYPQVTATNGRLQSETLFIQVEKKKEVTE